MELPEDVLQLIRDFSRPLTRSDWRTCKTKEPAIIQKFARDTIRWFEDLYERMPELHHMAPGPYKKRNIWTMYQRILMIKRLIARQNAIQN